MKTTTEVDGNWSENASVGACTNAHTYVCSYVCMLDKQTLPTFNALAPSIERVKVYQAQRQQHRKHRGETYCSSFNSEEGL